MVTGIVKVLETSISPEEVVDGLGLLKALVCLRPLEINPGFL
jgi:hypothetical protein